MGEINQFIDYLIHVSYTNSSNFYDHLGLVPTND